MKIRTDRWLTTLGLCSRSGGKDLIRAGQVRVNGRTVRDPGEMADPEADSLEVRGQAVDGRILRHVMLHKPPGLLTAARDARQPTVMDLLPRPTGPWAACPWGAWTRTPPGCCCSPATES